jgi:hypothetical protein
VDILKVMQSPFLAQYGNFTAGIVSAETLRGAVDTGMRWETQSLKSVRAALRLCLDAPRE